MQNELKEVEEKFRKAMVANAGLDNDKSQLTYQVDLLKDRLEETEEQSALISRFVVIQMEINLQQVRLNIEWETYVYVLSIF